MSESGHKWQCTWMSGENLEAWHSLIPLSFWSILKANNELTYNLAVNIQVKGCTEGFRYPPCDQARHHRIYILLCLFSTLVLQVTNTEKACIWDYIVLRPLVIVTHTLTVRPWPWISCAVPQGCPCVVVQWFGPTQSGGRSCHTADGSLKLGGATRL